MAAYGILLRTATRRKSIEPPLRAVASTFEDRDRRFLWTLTQETVRWQARLDAVVAPLLHRPIGVIDLPIRLILRLCACQACLLDQVPDHAIVDEGVRLARQFAKPGAEKLVNAVARRLVQDGRARWGLLEASENPQGWPVSYSHPAWLVERWRKRWGEERTKAVLAWDNQKPPVWLRARPGGRVPPGEAGWVPDTYRMPEVYRPAEDPDFLAGHWTVQDQGEALVCLLPPDEGEDPIFDMCAAPGTKTSHLLSRYAGRQILAMDRTRTRIHSLLETIGRVGGDAPTLIGDGERPPLPDGAFGGVLVDAPCSALGVLRRRVDARWNVRAKDLPRHGRQQRRLLHAAGRLLRQGGWLLYCVCSTEPEETDFVRDAFLAEHRGFRPRPFAQTLPEGLLIDEGTLRVLPGHRDCDGVYACLFEKRSDQ